MIVARLRGCEITAIGRHYVVDELLELQVGDRTRLVNSWRALLTPLGVLDWIHVEDVSSELQRDEVDEVLGAAERWAGLEADNTGLSNGVGALVLTDKVSPELENMVRRLLSTAAVRKADRGQDCSPEAFEQLSALAVTLDKKWGTYADACVCVVGRTDNGRTVLNPQTGQKMRVLQTADHERRMWTTFGIFVRTQAWLPALRPATYTSGAETGSTLYAAGDLWEDNAEVRALLHNHVPYLKTDMIADDRFKQTLGIRTSITHDELLALIRKWAEAGAKGRFRTTIKHMATVYAYLWMEMKSPANHKAAKDVQEFFAHQQCIFIPFNLEAKPSDEADGRFYCASEVSWADPSKKMDMLGYRILTRHCENPQIQNVASFHDIDFRGSF